jgi:glycosyltransferase involved in cell wall biosynthesis
MVERRALWVSTSTQTRGGIATYVRAMQQTPLWTDWNIRHIPTHRDGSVAVKIAEFARGALLFLVELIRFRPSVVHLHTASGGSFIRKGILFWICQFARVPVIVHVHGAGYHVYYENSPPAIQAVIRATLGRASNVVALGEVWAARLSAIAPTARITIIPNAVQLARRIVQPAPGEPVQVVFLGRIDERKGAFRLLDAWARLARDPDFDVCSGKAAALTIAGDGAASGNWVWKTPSKRAGGCQRAIRPNCSTIPMCWSYRHDSRVSRWRCSRRWREACASSRAMSAGCRK